MTKKRLIILLSVIFAILLCLKITAYVNSRIRESDMVWVGTKLVGMRVLVYANDNNGHFPSSLEDEKLYSKFNDYEKAYVKKLLPVYTPPSDSRTNVAKLVTAETKWERISFQTDGTIIGTKK